MMQVSYFNPGTEQVVASEVDTLDDVTRIIKAVSDLASGRGRPTVEITRPDGSTLAVSSDEEQAFLVWVDSLGESYHSVGHGGTERDLVFDYFGSWSEAPGEYLITLDAARECIRTFVQSGSPVTASVLFGQD